MNSVQLVGNVGKDPEVRTTNSGQPVASFTLATRDGKDETSWHRITVFGKQAEVVQSYVNKGDRLGVEGRIQYRTYEDKDGVTRHSTDIIGNRVHLLTSRADKEGPSRKNSGPKQASLDNVDEDIPF